MWTAVKDYPSWDIVITSPLQRCHAFALAYADKHGLNVVTDDRLREIGFGCWEGKSSQQILTDNPQAIRNFYHDPVRYRPEGAEPLSDFQQRVSASLIDISQQQSGKKVLVVAHAGVLRAAVTHTLNTTPSAMYKISIGNAAIVRIKDDGIRPATLILNELAG